MFVNRKGELKNIILQSVCNCKGKCYASALQGNGLFEVKRDGTLKFISFFPNEPLEYNNLFSEAISYDKYVIFVPGKAEYICVLDTDSMKITALPIRKYADKLHYQKNAKFSTAIYYQNHIYIFPQTYPAIIKMRCDTWELEYLDGWVTSKKIGFKKGIVVQENKVVVPSVYSKIYMQFEMGTDIVKIVDMQCKDDYSGAWSVCCDGENYWMIMYPKPGIAKINNCKIEENNVFPENFQDGGYAFAMSFIHDGNVYACPVRSNMVIKVNCASFHLDEVVIDNFLKENCALMYLCKYGKYLVFARYRQGADVWSSEDAEQIFLDIEKIKVSEINFRLENAHDYVRSYLKEKAQEDGNLKETNEIGLNEFLYSLK